MPRAGEGQRVLERVVHGVDTGHDRILGQVADDAVEQLKHVRWGQVEAGVGTYRRAQLSHDGRGTHATAHHVADHERDPAGAELDHVVPVPADLGLAFGAVVHSGPQRAVDEGGRGEKAPLEFGGDSVLAGSRLFDHRRRPHRFLGSSPFGEVQAGADVTGESARQVEDGAADIEYPPVTAVRMTQPVLRFKRLPVVEGLAVERDATVEIRRVYAFGPAVSQLLLNRAAGERKPGVVEVVASAVSAGPPDQQREIVEKVQVVRAHLPGPLQLQVRPHPCSQFRDRERFGQVVIRPCLQPGDRGVFPRACRQHDYRQMRR